jgi:hypothetical protein
MPSRQDETPDDQVAILRAAETLAGSGAMTHDEAAEAFADPETARKYREEMAKERERKAKAMTPTP